MSEDLVSVDEVVAALRELSSAKPESWPKMLYQWLGKEGSGRPLVDRRRGDSKVPTNVPRITRVSFDAFVANWQPRGRRGASVGSRPESPRAEDEARGSSVPVGGPLDGTTDVHELVVRLSSADAAIERAETDYENKREALLKKLEKLEVANVHAKYENKRLADRLEKRDARLGKLKDRRATLEKVIRDRLGLQGTQDIPPG